MSLTENKSREPMNLLLQGDGGDGVDVAELQAALREREADIQRLKEELEASTVPQVDTVPQVRLKRRLTLFLYEERHR